MITLHSNSFKSLCHSSGDARKCIKVGGEFYSCGTSEDLNRAPKAAKTTFHHNEETNAGMVEVPASAQC